MMKCSNRFSFLKRRSFKVSSKTYRLWNFVILENTFAGRLPMLFEVTSLTKDSNKFLSFLLLFLAHETTPRSRPMCNPTSGHPRLHRLPSTK